LLLLCVCSRGIGQASCEEFITFFEQARHNENFDAAEWLDQLDRAGRDILVAAPPGDGLGLAIANNNGFLLDI
jgi:hypothetical protein